MKRKPTTSPQIDNQPASFVRLDSRVAGDYGHKRSQFTDSRGVPYIRNAKGVIYRVRTDAHDADSEVRR